MKPSLLPGSLVLVAAVGLAFAWQPAPAAPAAQNPQSDAKNLVSVSVTGEAMTAPDWLQIGVQVSSFAEASEEALENFDQNRTRAMDGLISMGPEALEILPGGLKLKHGTKMKVQSNDMNRGFVMGGMGEGPKVKKGLNVVEDLTLRVPSTGDLAQQRSLAAQVMDSVLDLGLTLVQGGKGLAEDSWNGTFTSTSRSSNDSSRFLDSLAVGRLNEESQLAAERKAQAHGMERARAAAEALAKAGGRELGACTSISQSSLKTEFMGLGQEMRTRCTLKVYFELR